VEGSGPLGDGGGGSPGRGVDTGEWERSGWVGRTLN